MSSTTLSMAAWHAMRAVSLRPLVGRYAASQYARKHGVSSLYRLALQLAASSN